MPTQLEVDPDQVESVEVDPSEVTPVLSGKATSKPADKPPEKFLLRRGAEALGGFPDIPSELAAGAAKGAGSTAYGATKLTNQVIRAIPGVKKYVPEFPEKPDILKPKTTTEKVGETAEQVGEFFLPGGAISEGGKVIEAATAGMKGAKALSAIGRGALEAGSAGAISAIQGRTPRESLLNATIAGVIPIAALPVKKITGKIGEKITNSLLRPNATDLKDGYDVANIFKHGVQGNVQQILEKTGAKIQGLVNQTKQIIGSAGGDIDLNQILSDAETELKSRGAANFGKNMKIKKAIKYFKQEIEKIAPQGTVSVPDAQAAKVSLGRFGAWAFGKQSPKAEAIEKVANSMYPRLRVAIEQKAPQIASINKELSELIPIERAAMRRIPVDMRNNMISLSDAVLGGIASLHWPSWWMGAANRFLKSGLGARTFKAVSEKAGPLAPIASKAAAGTASQIESSLPE